MSSIYKKKRDGYYYYQAYIFDPTTKKKNKKVYQALGTKDITKAKVQQIKLDKKFFKLNQKEGGEKNQLNLTNKGLSGIIIVTFIAISVITYHFNFTKPKSVNFFQNNNNRELFNSELRDKNKRNDTEKYFLVKDDLLINEKVVSQSELSSKLTSKEELLHAIPDKINRSKPRTSLEEKSLKKEQLNDTRKKSESVNNFPQYSIIRTKQISDSFNQGEIYLTTKEGIALSAKRKICEDAVKKHPEFTNVVVCLYSDSENGRKLSRGIDEDFTIREKQQAWLAMYTFNIVEGVYFDDNPAKYLGNY